MTVQEIVGEPLAITVILRRSKRVQELLALVGLNPKYLSRYPHAFSGGQRQRPASPERGPDPSLIVQMNPSGFGSLFRLKF